MTKKEKNRAAILGFISGIVVFTFIGFGGWSMIPGIILGVLGYMYGDTKVG